MGGNRYPELIRRLKAAGCTFVRQGKGSHEIWFCPLTNRSVVVPRNTQVAHTAKAF